MKKERNKKKNYILKKIDKMKIDIFKRVKCILIILYMLLINFKEK